MIETVKERRWRAIRVMLIALLSIMLLGVLFTPTLAASHPFPQTDDWEKDFEVACSNLKNYSKGGWLASVAFKWTCTANGTNPEFSFINSAAKLALLGDPGHNSLWVLLTEIYNGAKVVGITLMVLYFFLGIMDKIQMDQFTTEQLFRKLIGLCIAVIIIDQGANILTWIIEISDALAKDMRSNINSGIYSASGSVFSPQGCYESLIDAGWFECVGLGLAYIIDALPLYLIQMVTYVGVMFAMFSRVLELVVRFAMAPIGIAPIVSDGMRSSGVRYIKQFASVCLQSALIFAILYLNQRVADDMSMGTSMVAYFVLPLVAMGMVFKSKRIADDIIGV